MRLILFAICMATIHCPNNLIGQTGSDTMRNTSKENTIRDQIPQIINQIGDKSIPIEKILPRIRHLENLSNEDSYWYLETMRHTIMSLQNRDNDEKAMAAGKEILSKASFVALDKATESNVARRCKALFCQMDMLLTHQYRFHRTESLIDSDPSVRKKYAFRLIELYQLILSQSDDDHDSNANVFITGHDFVPPSSYQGRIIPGSISQIDIRTRTDKWITGCDTNQTSHSITSVKGTLRTTKHIYTFHIKKTKVKSGLLIVWDIIYIQTYCRRVNS